MGTPIYFEGRIRMTNFLMTIAIAAIAVCVKMAVKYVLGMKRA